MIWCFGPGSNILVNKTNQPRDIIEIKDSCVAAFNWVVKEGVLIESPVRGVQLNISNAILYTDAIHS